MQQSHIQKTLLLSVTGSDLVFLTGKNIFQGLLEEEAFLLGCHKSYPNLRCLVNVRMFLVQLA